MRTASHHFRHWILTIVVTLVIGTAAISADSAPQHPLVGKPFKLADVEHANPVYETSFDDEAVLRD